MEQAWYHMWKILWSWNFQLETRKLCQISINDSFSFCKKTSVSAEIYQSIVSSLLSKNFFTGVPVQWLKHRKIQEFFKLQIKRIIILGFGDCIHSSSNINGMVFYEIILQEILNRFICFHKFQEIITEVQQIIMILMIRKNILWLWNKSFASIQKWTKFIAFL